MSSNEKKFLSLLDERCDQLAFVLKDIVCAQRILQSLSEYLEHLGCIDEADVVDVMISKLDVLFVGCKDALLDDLEDD